MSAQRLLPLLLAALGGGAITWVIKPGPTPAEASKETQEPVLKRETRRDGNENSRIAARWIDRMPVDDQEKVQSAAKEVPPGEMKAVLDGLMSGIWGSLSSEEVTRLQLLIGEWAQKDPEGALAWARALKQPQQREVGLCSIAIAVGEKDPQAGFGILAELEKVTMLELFMGNLTEVVQKTCANAAKDGPDALREALRRIPEGDRWTMGLTIEYPPGFDFHGLMEGMKDDGYFNLADRPSRAMALDPLSQWAAADGDAAFSYLVENAKSGSTYNFHELTDKMAETRGKHDAREWLGEKLAALDSAQRQQLALGSMSLHHSPPLEEIIRAMPTPELQMELRQDLLQAGISSGNTINFELLSELPDLETRLATLEQLHGMDGDSEEVVDQLRKWNVPQERIDGIMEKVTRDQ